MIIPLLVALAALATSPAQAESDARARPLFEARQWSELIRQFPPAPDDTPDMHLRRGIAQARLEHWDAARAEFESGLRKAPEDARLATELAGVAFRQGRRRDARRLLGLALRLRPHDEYATGFLATIHLLDGNARAALKVWNRIGAPRVEAIREVTRSGLDPALMDRALAVRPASRLLLGDYDATLRRLDLLEVFRSRALELAPRQDGAFDLELRTVEKKGLGDGWAEGIAGLLRGLPYSTVYPEFFNLRHSAVNSVSLWRWDARKRRLATSLSGPVGGDPAKRFRLDLDARDEEWDLSRAPMRAGTESPRLWVKKIEAGTSFQVAAGPWLLESGGSVAARDFRGALPLPAAIVHFRDGVSLKYGFAVHNTALSSPERRFEAPWDAAVHLGKMWGEPGGRFSSITAGVSPVWYPLARGDDYRMSGRIRAGAIHGAAPLDELFSFGLERDNELGMRGHPGTDAGRKGRGPLGTAFVLASWEIDKRVAGNGLWRLSAGPFVDTGRMWDGRGAFGTSAWLADTGVQSHVSVLRILSLTLSFGRDLRSGGHALYFTARRTAE